MDTKKRKDLVKKYQRILQADLKKQQDEKLKNKYKKLKADIKELESLLERLYDRQLELREIIRERAKQ